MVMHVVRATHEATPAMRNRPQKLLRPMLFEETELVSSGQLGVCPNHAFSNCSILAPSVTFKTSLETSATRGEPFGNT